MAYLRPWNGKRNAGMLSFEKLTMDYLVADFKCTVFDCGFYTDSLPAINLHFQTHQNTGLSSVAQLRLWLECWCCKYVASSVSEVLKHICTVHRYCGYQCNLCCYRSRDSNSVIVHQRRYHPEHFDASKIICLHGRQKPYNSMDDDTITNEMRINVKPLQCSHCNMRRFTDLDEFVTHIEGHKKIYIECHICGQLTPTRGMIGHIKLHNMYLFQCIYCDYGTFATAAITEHVAEEHPERMLCYHTRCSRNNFPPFVRVLQKIDPKRFVVCPSKRTDVHIID
uniref:C2H2-type domain-containing protein n=1 Tax=Anopheles epiroticus TaxID=199890 RepID=A0A182PVD7_9DIPT